MTRWLFCVLVLFTGAIPTHVRSADQKWAFSPPKRPTIPQIENTERARNPIDTFLLARLEIEDLTYNRPAEKLALLRRVTFDLTGLSPTLTQQRDFLEDQSPEAYERVVERLLTSPRFGERQAQHWLDLVRYAESNGFKADEHRPNAFRYRDYVIEAFNRDLPYDRFVRQQIAGDELEPGNPQALIATGFLRLYPDESNAANLEQRRQEILNDLTDVTGQVFLAMTFGCARCHDHKFDPTTQEEYYALQSCFAPIFPRDDLPAVTPGRLRAYRQQRAQWEKATSKLRQEIEQIVSKKRESIRRYALGKFRKEIQDAVRTPRHKRTAYQMQIATMAEKQLDFKARDAANQLKGSEKNRYQDLSKQLRKFAHLKPRSLPRAMAVSDVSMTPPPTHILSGGDWRKPKKKVSPKFPAFLGQSKVEVSIASKVKSTGRRAALARWLTQDDNPLTARVIANRLWQQHFGRGLVSTGNDFGLMGADETHPKLLDWLAVELVENKWSLKHLHRLMVTSEAYRQSSLIDLQVTEHARARKADRSNSLLWHMRRRRLEGEAIRDAILMLTEELNHRMNGKSAKPKLPPKISKYAWTPDAKAEDRNRRSIYVLAKRNMRYPLFDTFDLSDMHNSCSRRAKTTTAPQALYLMNGTFVREQSKKWAKVLQKSTQGLTDLVTTACQQIWCRVPDQEEIASSIAFIDQQTTLLQKSKKGGRPEAIADFCHALLNSNEFLYID